jgi:hypothetical protein
MILSGLLPTQFDVVMYAIEAYLVRCTLADLTTK